MTEANRTNNQTVKGKTKRRTRAPDDVVGEREEVGLFRLLPDRTRLWATLS